MAIAFYGFQSAPNVHFVTPDTKWSGWLTNWALPIIKRGFPDQHLHNPFGLYDIRDRAMHIDQFELASCRRLPWLASAGDFAKAVAAVHDQGGAVRAYVGSPLVVPDVPRLSDLPRCMPGATSISIRLRVLRGLGLCNGSPLPGPFGQPCLCWGRLISFYIGPLVEAKVDAIGFDASTDFRPGSCMDRLVRQLISAGMEIMIEPWPRNDRDYPPVSWIVRERLYHRIRLERRNDEAPLQTVVGKIYRIVPADDTEHGRDEIKEINDLLVRHGENTFSNTQDIVDAARSDGHVPLVRSHQLRSSSVTPVRAPF